MFDDSNRIFQTSILIDLRSVVMAVLWLSLLIVAFHFIRRRTRLIQNFGIVTLVIMLGFMLVRSFAPLNFSFTKNISSTIYGNISYFFTEFELFRIPGIDFPVTPLVVLFLVWLVGAVVSFLLFLRKTRKTMKLYRSTMHHPLAQEQRILDEVVCAEFGRKNRFRLRHAMVNTPLTYGFFRPTILIPLGQIYNERELYCVLLHELTHYYHRDSWIKLLVQILCCLFWWNPLVYLFQKDVDQTVELHCDASVCAKLTSQEQCDYLSAIANTLQFSKKINKLMAQQTGAVSKLASDDGKEQLKQRLNILMKISESPKHTKRYYFFACLLMAVVMLFSYLFTFTPEYTQYGKLEEMVEGVAITQQNSYLVEYPENCYSLILSDDAIQVIAPLADADMVQEALEIYQLEVRQITEEEFIHLFEETGVEDAETMFDFFVEAYFPDAS